MRLKFARNRVRALAAALPLLTLAGFGSTASAVDPPPLKFETVLEDLGPDVRAAVATDRFVFYSLGSAVFRIDPSLPKSDPAHRMCLASELDANVDQLLYVDGSLYTGTRSGAHDGAIYRIDTKARNGAGAVRLASGFPDGAAVVFVTQHLYAITTDKCEIFEIGLVPAAEPERNKTFVRRPVVRSYPHFVSGDLIGLPDSLLIADNQRLLAVNVENANAPVTAATAVEAPLEFGQLAIVGDYLYATIYGGEHTEAYGKPCLNRVRLSALRANGRFEWETIKNSEQGSWSTAIAGDRDAVFFDSSGTLAAGGPNASMVPVARGEETNMVHHPVVMVHVDPAAPSVVRDALTPHLVDDTIGVVNGYLIEHPSLFAFRSTTVAPFPHPHRLDLLRAELLPEWFGASASGVGSASAASSSTPASSPVTSSSSSSSSSASSPATSSSSSS